MAHTDIAWMDSSHYPGRNKMVLLRTVITMRPLFVTFLGRVSHSAQFTIHTLGQSFKCKKYYPFALLNIILP